MLPNVCACVRVRVCVCVCVCMCVVCVVCVYVCTCVCTCVCACTPVVIHFNILLEGLLCTGILWLKAKLILTNHMCRRLLIQLFYVLCV